MLVDRVDTDKFLSAVSMLKVIAHPVRLAIVDLLTERQKMTLLELQDALDLEQAIASQQVTLMEQRGVLISEKIGRNKFVSLRYPKMKNIIHCLENCCQEM